MKIDIIVPYVDEHDESWQQDFNHYKEEEIKKGIQSNSNRQAFARERTRDWNTFRYWFRGVEKNCSWVNKVFLVVQRESQIPSWLDRDNPKLRIVLHEEFIPQEFLSTFSTLTIETFYYRIPDLSEYFIVSNDDFFFLNEIPEDLFFKDNKIHQGICGYRPKDWKCDNKEWETIISNNNHFLEKNVLNKQLDKFYHYSHLPDGRVKSFETSFIEKYKDEIYDSLRVSKFRHMNNLIPSLLYIDAMKYTNYGCLDDRVYKNSKYVTIDSRTNFFNYKDCEMVCFNDTACVDDFNVCKGKLLEFLKYKFPDKSSFEKDDEKLKKCFGIVSWLPDKEPNRTQRINRLNSMFNQFKEIFGNDIEYLIVAQNWKDYKVPSFVNAQIFEYNKLGILGARKTLGKHFLESSYDYIIMCDDDVILKTNENFTSDNFFKELDNHPNGFMFLQYSWSLNLCAISKSIYAQTPMIDIDPEKNEGYEDVVWPNLLHYKHKDKEFKVKDIQFTQNKIENVVNAPSTWDNNVNHQELAQLSNFYVERFKKGKFDIDKQKAKAYLGTLKYCENARWHGWLRDYEIKELLDKYLN